MVIVIVVARLLVPLTMLRWPLFGIFASIALDGYDYSTLYNSALGGDSYQYTDKLLDTYFLGVALYVSRRWQDKLAKQTMLWLFGYRTVGVTLFFITGQESLLVIFPNLVLNFFIFYLLFTLLTSARKMVSGRRDLATIILVMLIPKLLNEYYLHAYRVAETPLTPYLNEFYSLPSLVRLVAYLVLPVTYLAWRVYRHRVLVSSK